MEEQAWLVRTRSDSEGSSKLSFGSLSRTMTYTDHRLTGAEGVGEPGNAINMTSSPPDNAGDGNESGELLDYNDSSVLEQFHEDALKQAGCGASQARVLLAIVLAMAGSAVELAAIPFILPSAEIELCILPHEKNWLVMISLVGCSLGAVGWGVLAERLGRRRTLLSCLAVNSVFAAIAAFMPTYGTFMMARFCSAIGSGGVPATCVAYACESAGARWRRACCACACAAMAAGGLAAAALACAVLPHTGALALIENKEHFSAWHRYLLLCMLPILASLVSLIWTQESPRYLLDVGREVDAMIIYQSIHSSNKVRVCGKKTGGADAELRVGEVSLPGKRPPPALHHVRHSVKMFWQAFFQLFSNAYRSRTLSLGGTLLIAFLIQFYLSSYVSSTVVKMENERFENSKLIVSNGTLKDLHYDGTLENVRFENVTFINSTFRDILMSHIAFRNCSFRNVSLSNVKSSYTTFEGCTFINSTIIDTDLEEGRELDPECRLIGTVMRGMRGACSRHTDLTSRLSGPTDEQKYGAYAALLASLLVLIPGARPYTGNVPVCIAGVLASPLLYMALSEKILYAVEAAYRFLMMVLFFNVSVGVIDSYPANLRCTAHGLILSLSFMGGAIVRGCGHGGPLLSTLLVAGFSLALIAFRR